jgi:hypothetical protein
MNRKYIYIVLAILVTVVIVQFDRVANDNNYSINIDEFRNIGNVGNLDNTGNLDDIDSERRSSFIGSLVNKGKDILLNSGNKQDVGADNEQDKQNSDDHASDAQASQEQVKADDQDATEDKLVFELPVIDESQISTVDLKILKQKGRVEIVDIDGETYLDIAALARYYGKRVTWDNDTEQFTCKLFGVEFKGSSLDNEVFINGKPIILEEPVFRIDHRTYIPADAFAEVFGAEIVLSDTLLEVKVRNVIKALMVIAAS